MGPTLTLPVKLPRTAIAAVLIVGVLAALLGSWFASGWRGVRAEQRAIRADTREASEEQAGEAEAMLERRLEALKRREDERPHYHYQSLFHDPRGASEGEAVVPSPLADGPDDPLIAVYFQIDGHGKVTLPTINDAVPELNAADLDDDRFFRDEIARATRDLRVDPDGVQVAMAGPKEQRVEVLQQQQYVQNMRSDEVYQSAKAKRPIRPALPDAEETVEIAVDPLEWKTAKIGPVDALVARRFVSTPDGPLTQGFVIRKDTVVDLLGEFSGASYSIRADQTPAGYRWSDWEIVVDDPEANAAADARADAVATAFLQRFVPTSVLAAALAALVVLMMSRAERAARQRAQFAAAAAHELRTPLAGLQLYGDMLADGLGNPERSADYARRMSEEAARLGRVVSNVLDFSHLERGNLSVSSRPGDAATVVTDAVERARPALERAGVTLRVEVPDELPAILDADALARILGNLLDNAEKYGRGAADRTVAVTAARTGDAVTISVRDAGPGIGASQAAQRLFRPFHRGAASEAAPGLGLGLALSRSLARAMGGDLAHRPAPGGGADFVVTLRSR